MHWSLKTACLFLQVQPPSARKSLKLGGFCMSDKHHFCGMYHPVPLKLYYHYYYCCYYYYYYYYYCMHADAAFVGVFAVV